MRKALVNYMNYCAKGEFCRPHPKPFASVSRYRVFVCSSPETNTLDFRSMDFVDVVYFCIFLLMFVVFCWFPGPPNPWRLFRSCRRSFCFPEQQITLLDFGSMYFVDVVDVCDFCYFLLGRLDLYFWCLDLSMRVVKGCKTVRAGSALLRTCKLRKVCSWRSVYCVPLRLFAENVMWYNPS